MNTTELIILIVVIGMLITDIVFVTIKSTKTENQLDEMRKKLINMTSNSLQKILPYNELFTLLDVIIVSEVGNYISINNLKTKNSTEVSVALTDTIIELSNKIYTDGISRTMITQLEYYVTTKFIMEYISRSVRNNLLSSTIPNIYKK